MSFDVTPEHLAWIRAILARHVPTRAVLAFGSRARGTSRPTSDLDICILGDEPLDFGVLGRLKDDFSESNLPYKVDVVDWATLSPAFRAIVADGAEVLRKPG